MKDICSSQLIVGLRLVTGMLIYKSLSFVSMCNINQNMLFEQIWFYDLTAGNGFRCVHELEVARLLQKNQVAISEKSEESHSQGLY